MSLTPVKLPQAKLDLIELADFIARDNEAAAERSLQAVDETIEWLAQLPEIGSPWESHEPRHAGLKFQNVKGFPNHLIFYRPSPHAMTVIRILHGSRDLDGLLG